MIVASNDFMLAQLALEIAVGGDLNAVKIHLYTNDLTPNRQNVLADFVEATFHGYAASAAVVWGTPFIDVNNVPTVLSDMKTFIMTVGSPANPEQVYGWYLTDNPATKVFLSERFSTSVFMAAAGNQVSVVAQPQAVSQTG